MPNPAVKRIMLSVLVTLLLQAFFLPEVFSMPHGNPVTPYGDFCKKCGNYGTCRNLMNRRDAETALSEYYGAKGYTIAVENMRGRFIKARIMDRDNVVDVILFDRRTGRVRSVY